MSRRKRTASTSLYRDVPGRFGCSCTDEDGIKAAELEGEFATMNGWEAESDAENLLNGLGIETDLWIGAAWVVAAARVVGGTAWVAGAVCGAWVAGAVVAAGVGAAVTAGISAGLDAPAAAPLLMFVSSRFFELVPPFVLVAVRVNVPL